ncbi:MAG: response regulator, partial [Candidatus Sumerlaeaceae bacterium]|nr:response regulator [Candidatus Sumerlaeaceae bacterium]
AVADETASLFHWDAHFVAIKEPGHEEMAIISNYDTIDGKRKSFYKPDFRLMLSEPARPVMDGQTVLINRPVEEGDKPMNRIGDVSRPSASLMFGPVRSGREIVGVISFQSYTPNRYSEQDTAQLLRVGDVVAPAIRRAYAEQELRQSESRLRALLDALPDLMFRVSRDGIFLDYKSSSLDLYAPPRVFLGKTIADMFPPDIAAESMQLIHKAIDAGKVQYHEYSLPSEDGRRHFEGRIVRSGTDEATIIVREITDRIRAVERQNKLEVKVQQAQKLESLGVLTGGIAHDFNNLLVGILGNAGLALMDLPADSPVRPLLDAIETTAIRASELTRQMLAYSGRGKFVVQPLNLSQLVREMVQLLEFAISKNAALRLEFGSDLPPIDADATQIRQVVMNLITNASDALGDLGGVITIRTGSLHASKSDVEVALASEGLSEGDYVFVEVADTGCGMDKATVARIFDPFYTTKFAGRGLGLAATLGIIRGHRGGITVESEPGRGAKFRVLFPCASGKDGPETPRAQERQVTWKGSGRILVVDDDETVRNVATRILKSKGFEVTVARDGREGLDIYDKTPEDFRLVLLDMTMPGMSGEEVFRELKGRNSRLPILLSSGYAEQDVTGKLKDIHPEAFIQKPYRADQLTATVKSLLS